MIAPQPAALSAPTVPELSIIIGCNTRQVLLDCLRTIYQTAAIPTWIVQ